MKKLRLLLSITLVASLIFVSCDDDDDTKDTTKPTVTNLEAGHDGEMHIGEGLHLEFDVEDNDVLDYYSVEIHAGEEGAEEAETGWKYEEEFDEIHNKRNYTVHHHDIIIPEDIEEGEYHFHLRVIDMSGNVTLIEKHLHATHEEVEGDNDHDHEE